MHRRVIATCSGEQYRANASRSGVLFFNGVGSTNLSSACQLLLAVLHTTTPFRCVTQGLWQLGLLTFCYACQVCPIQRHTVAVPCSSPARISCLVRQGSRAWVPCAVGLLRLTQGPLLGTSPALASPPPGFHLPHLGSSAFKPCGVGNTGGLCLLRVLSDLSHLCSLLLLTACRFGEAANPGPRAGTVALGCFNPTGLNGKSAVTASLENGVLGVSETHLTAKGIQHFRAGSQTVRSPFRLHHGAAVRPRAGSSFSGEYSGVGFLASCPARSAPCSWPEGLHETGRIHVVNFFIQPLWLLGGVAYGFPTCPHKTSFLLDELTQRVVVEGSGPRFLCGDYNVEYDHLVQASFWRSKGFIEIQDLHQRLTGVAPKATCKGKTRKDFCWISPELQSLFIETVVDELAFADHAVIYARLRVPQQGIPRFVWRMPVQFASSMVPNGPLPVRSRVPITPAHVDPDSCCRGIFAQYEHAVSEYGVSKGQAPLPPLYRGRACTTDVVVKRQVRAPIPRGRKGEVKPTYLHPSLQYAQHFRQLRRLQALVQDIEKGSASTSALEYRSGLWASILSSTGFVPSFTVWWGSRPVQLVGDPPAIPLEPPPLSIARALFRGLEANIRHSERRRQQQFRRDAREARRTSPALIFKDLREPLSQSVETLLETCEGVVEEVDHEEFSITTESKSCWREHLPLLTPKGPIELAHAEPDKLWGTTSPDVKPGDIVRQERYLGSLPDIFRAFGDAWSKRWLKHQDLSAGRWDGILDSVQSIPDNQAMQLEPITLPLWRQTVRDKHSRTSAGPDGISRLDLLTMPDDLNCLIIDICHHAEATGRWPRSALQGVVSAIQKSSAAAQVGDFRPITIFSLIYRCWSSLRARQCLSYLDKIAPAGLCGNRPGVSASTVWYSLQASVEAATLDGGKLCGFTADVTKAFNCIPRTPALAIGVRKGLHRDILRGWTGALVGIARRFKVRSSVGHQHHACTGFPEGCALSCVGMLLVNLALHEVMHADAPQAPLSTFVDNWSCSGPTPACVDQAFRSLSAFAEKWDLDLDMKKLIFWSTDPAHRKALKSLGHPTRLEFRELGAHVRFSRRRTTRWGRLEASLSPYHRRVAALKTAAWPRALHGVSNVHLGESNFGLLRSGAMRGTGAKAPGANPLLHLGLVEYPLADPGFVAIRESFLDARRHAPQVNFVALLGHLATGNVAPIPGPASILSARANDIAISWDLDTQKFRDSFGNFDLWTCSPQELDFRLCWAWQLGIAAKMQHRPGFQGLVSVDPALSRRVLASLPPAQKASIRVARNGTFFTQDALHHFQEGETPNCVYCGAADSIRHRAFTCPHFSEARMGLEIPVEELALLDDFQALHAWGRRSPLLQEFYCSLLAPVNIRLLPLSGEGPMDLFTDGSCIDPKNPDTRVAAWAVVQGSVEGPPTVVASGPLQGLMQTAYRAEISAALHACRRALTAHRPARIWSDCQGVVTRLRRLISGSWQPKAGSYNYDLWLELAEVVSQCPGLLQVLKVAAHDDDDTYDVASLWVLHHNRLADEAASAANTDRGEAFWQQWMALRADVAREEVRARALLRLHSRVALIAVHSNQRPCLDPTAPDPDPVPPAGTFMLPEESDGYARLLQRFPADYVDAVRRWYKLAFCSTAAQRAPVRWISVLQLFTDFVATIGCEPVQYRGETREWFLPGSLAAHDVIEVDLPRKLRWFAQSLKGVARFAGGTIQFRELRPYSSTVLTKCSCLAVRMANSRLLISDGWLALSSKTGVLLRNREWQKLPSPKMNPALG